MLSQNGESIPTNASLLEMLCLVRFLVAEAGAHLDYCPMHICPTSRAAKWDFELLQGNVNFDLRLGRGERPKSTVVKHRQDGGEVTRD